MPTPESPHHQAHTPPANSDASASPAPEPAAAAPSNKSPQKHAKKEPKKRGRPTVFNKQKRDSFCIMIQMGCSVRAAAAHLGIDKKTVQYARHHDPEFDYEVRSAEHSRNMDLLSNIVSAGHRSWRASAWLLSAVQPELYGALRRRGGATPVARDKHRLKEFVANIVNEILRDSTSTRRPARTAASEPARQPAHQPDPALQAQADLAVAAIDERLAEIEAESKRPPGRYPAFEALYEDPEPRNILAEHIARLKNRLVKKHGPKRNSNNTADKQRPRSA